MGTAASAVQANAKRGAICNKSCPDQNRKEPTDASSGASRLSGGAKDLARIMLQQIPPGLPYLPLNFRCYNRKVAVGIAQLAEHRTVAPAVAGSIPVSHPKYLPHGMNFVGTAA